MLTRIRDRDCLTEGELRLLLDAELDSGTGRRHLAGCAACAGRLDAIRADSMAAATAMARMRRESDPPDVPTSYGRLRARLRAEQWTQRTQLDGGDSRMNDLWGRRWVRAAGALTALFVMMLAFTITPMRTVANDFLNQFRVRQFVAVTIPIDMLQPLESGMLANLSEADRAQLHEQFEQLGTFEMTFDLEALPAPVTLPEARDQFGDFDAPTELPDGYDAAPEAYVTEDGGASYALNVGEMRALIEEMNLPIYAFDGVTAETLTFQADIPAAVVLRYTAADGRQLVVGQMESPSLVIPDGFDMDELREDILRFPGLPAELVAQLRAIDDWETTLIIPVPEGATSENLDDVNGEPGLLIEYEDGAAVLWEQDGFLYAVFGQATAGDMLDAAESMELWEPAATE